MCFSIILIVLSAAFAATNPMARQSQNMTNFLLVTTTSRIAVADSSDLPDVNATSLFEPDALGDELYQLRLIGPGYGSLPLFSFSQGTLHTDAYGPVGVKHYEYNSTTVMAGRTLNFGPKPESVGNLGLKDGYLLTVDGECTGWTVCEGEHDQAEIYWKGKGTSCKARYIQAAKIAPY